MIRRNGKWVTGYELLKGFPSWPKDTTVFVNIVYMQTLRSSCSVPGVKKWMTNDPLSKVLIIGAAHWSMLLGVSHYWLSIGRCLSRQIPILMVCVCVCVCVKEMWPHSRCNSFVSETEERWISVLYNNLRVEWFLNMKNRRVLVSERQGTQTDHSLMSSTNIFLSSLWVD